MNKISIKFHLISLCSLVVAGLILNFIFPNTFYKPTASLSVDYGGKKTRVFSGEVVESMTILDALTASSQEANFNTLLSVDGLSDRITIKLNDRPVSVDMINQTTIKNGDLIEIQLP